MLGTTLFIVSGLLAAGATGSFNFSKSAQRRNAENGIVIRGDAGVVKAYADNRTIRQGKSSLDFFRNL